MKISLFIGFFVSFLISISVVNSREFAGIANFAERETGKGDKVQDDDLVSIDLAQLLGDLFSPAHDADRSNAREGRATDIKESIQFEPKVIAKYNNFIDAFLRRLSTTMRANHDPMNILIRKTGRVTGAMAYGRKGSKGNKRRKGNTNRRPANKNNKMNNRNRNNKNGANRKMNKRVNRVNRPRGRHPKDLNIDELRIQEHEENEQVLAKDDESIEETVHQPQQKIDLKSQGDDDELADDNDQDSEFSARESRDLAIDDTEEVGVEVAGKENTDVSFKVNRNGELRKGQRNNHNKGGKRNNGKCKRKCQQARRRKREQNKNKRGNKVTSHPRAVLSGISSIRRIGDVRISQKKGAQNIHCDIQVGPIVLRAQKTFGKGKNSQFRKAEAMAPEVNGKITISVTANGDAKIKKFRLFRPTAISISGSLRRDAGLSSDRFMQGYISKTSPFIARKLAAIARKILKIPKNMKNKNKNKNKNNQNIAN